MLLTSQSLHWPRAFVATKPKKVAFDTGPSNMASRLRLTLTHHTTRKIALLASEQKQIFFMSRLAYNTLLLPTTQPARCTKVARIQHVCNVFQARVDPGTIRQSPNLTYNRHPLKSESRWFNSHYLLNRSL